LNNAEIDIYLLLKAIQDKTYNCQSLLETLENPEKLVIVSTSINFMGGGASLMIRTLLQFRKR